MWKDYENNCCISDEELGKRLVNMHSGIAVLETGMYGTSKAVVLQMRRDAKDCVILSTNRIAQELVRGIREHPFDDEARHKYVRKLLMEHERQVVLIVDLAGKEATQIVLGSILYQISYERTLVFVCRSSQETPFLLAELGNQGRLFSWQDDC